MIGLLSRFGKERLGDYPTPLRYIRLDNKRGFWIKDEGRAHRSYGGNKVRKLEYLFGSARRSHRRRLVVWGDAGSHTVEAVSILGRESGFDVTAVTYSGTNLAAEGHQRPSRVERHAVVHQTRNILSAFVLARLKGMGPGRVYVPLGATTAYSTLGHLSAACEFVEQWQSIRSAWPKSIYVAMGSGGTVSGLATGFALLGIPIKINAVQTVNSSITNPLTLRKQVSAVLKLLELDAGLAKSILSDFVLIDRRYLGQGYGDVTPSSMNAIEKARNFGLELEPVHTGKVMAAVINSLITEETSEIIYWHTHSRTSPDLEC